MPPKANVIIQYGPYQANGIVDYSLSRLQGLKCSLTKDGHSVTFEKLEDWNAVKLSVNGEIVFQCDITELDFGSDGELDPLCKEARKEVERAY